MTEWKRGLEHGRLYRFRDWPRIRRDVPTNRSGVYTIWVCSQSSSILMNRFDSPSII